MTYTLTLDQPQTWPSANDRGHWAKRHRLTAYWRQVAALKAKQAKIPALDRAHVRVTFHKPTSRIFDPANLYPTAKACIDGIVGDAGVLPGDDFRYLDGPDMRAHPGSDGRRIVITITPLTEETR